MGAGLPRLRDEDFVRLHADNKDADIRQSPNDLTCGVDPIEPSHRDVEEGER
jgi:hypothetical protein